MNLFNNDWANLLVLWIVQKNFAIFFYIIYLLKSYLLNELANNIVKSLLTVIIRNFLKHHIIFCSNLLPSLIFNHPFGRVDNISYKHLFLWLKTSFVDILDVQDHLTKGLLTTCLIHKYKSIGFFQSDDCAWKISRLLCCIPKLNTNFIRLVVYLFPAELKADDSAFLYLVLLIHDPTFKPCLLRIIVA